MRKTPALGLMAASMVALSVRTGGGTADQTTAATSAGASATEMAAATVDSEHDLGP